MIKRLLIIAIASAALLMGTTMYAQKPEKKQPKGPRIMLEEVEVTLYENGKEIKRKRMTEKEKNEIRTELKNKAIKSTLKKLGLKKYSEMRENKMESKYHEELAKMYKVIKIDPPRLIAVDEKGRVLKEIPIKEEKTKAKYRDEHKKRDWDAEKTIRKRAAVSDNGMFGMVGINTSIISLRTPEFEKVYPYYYVGGHYSGKIIVYDNKGEVLFEKEYPKGTSISGDDGKIRISDTGTVAVITGSGEGMNRLHVYDRSGREILVYPGGEDYISIREPVISPNGKYLAVRNNVALFFNTTTGAMWRADKRYLVREISDSGIARIDITETIDLKEHLGE
jgi:hypothetical protein